MGINAGSLDRKIELLTSTKTTTAEREVKQDWTTLASVFAEYRPLNSTERFGANAVRSERACKFRIRYRSDVNQKLRVRYGTEEYRIVAINEMERRVGLELICEAVK